LRNTPALRVQRRDGKALLLRQTIRQTSKLSGCAKGRLRRRHIEALLRSIAGACIADSSPRLTPKARRRPSIQGSRLSIGTPSPIRSSGWRVFIDKPERDEISSGVGKGCAKALACGGMNLAICVLVVEDDPLVRFVAVQVLADAGFETLEAGDAAQALDALKGSERIDVLFTDVRMPGRMNGFELALVAQRRWPDLRVIVTSAYFDQSDLPSGTDFLHKPWTAHDLLRRVTQAAA
jgi:two-component system, response regulator PdtaR